MIVKMVLQNFKVGREERRKEGRKGGRAWQENYTR